MVYICLRSSIANYRQLVATFPNYLASERLTSVINFRQTFMKIVDVLFYLLLKNLLKFCVLLCLGSVRTQLEQLVHVTVKIY